MNNDSLLVTGFALGFGIIPIVWLLLKLVHVEVEDGEALLVTRFGKLTQTLTRPGWHWLVGRAMPWVSLRRVSTRRDFRHITGISVNDARGTTVVADVWLELRITDPEKAVFGVDDWDRSLKNLVSHAVTAIMGNREFKQILCDRMELGELLRRDIEAETSRWGIQIELAFVQKVSLLPEVSQQMFHSIAAGLERSKAAVEEGGRQKVALLEAETAVSTAKLLAEAKGQYPAAIGRAFGELQKVRDVFDAYNELYELSLVRLHRTVAFKGFQPGELRAVDAAMLVPPVGGHGALPGGDGEQLLPAHGGARKGLLNGNS